MEAFEAFKKDLEAVGYSPVINIDADVDYIVTKLYPDFFQIVSKNDSLFNEERILMGVNISEAFKSEKISKDTFWNHIVAILFASLGHGDFKSKIGPVITAVKKYFFITQDTESEYSKLFNDEKAEDNFKDIFEFVTNTRLVKVCMSMLENLDISEFGINIDKPEEFIEMSKNPDNPVAKKVGAKFSKLIGEKIARGEITKAQIDKDLEAIKAKVTSIFGNIFMNALGGGNGGISSADMMGNSPEARRQRMLARLQKKQREKNSL